MSHRPKRFYRNSSPKVAKVIRELYFIGKLKQTDIARMFGKSQGNVSTIISGKVWQ
jgi:predicted transcriptional regulator